METYDFGMASIVKRTLKDGSSAYLVRYRMVDGGQRSRQFDRRRDADAFAAKVETEKVSGQFVDPRRGKITLDEWIGEWWPTVTNLRPSTRDRDEIYMRRHVLPYFGQVPLSSIDRTSLRRWLAGLSNNAENPLAPATVHKISQVLNKALRAAHEDRLIPSNPAERLPLPKIEREEMRCLSIDDVHRLADTIDARYRSFVLLGAYGGLRLGEMLGLRVSGVSVPAQRVRVSQTLVDLNGHMSFGPPKTKAAVRNVTLPRFVIDSFDISGKAPDDLVLQSPEGGPIRASTWRRRYWEPALERAQLGPLRIHDLRHTSVSVVFDRYGHLYDEQDAPLVAALEAAAARVA